MVAERMQDERGVGVARVVGREDHRALEVANPLAALDLRVGHRLGERQEQPALNHVADGPYRFLSGPAEVARKRRHHSASLRPAPRTRIVPVPSSPDPSNVVGDSANEIGKPVDPHLA